MIRRQRDKRTYRYKREGHTSFGVVSWSGFIVDFIRLRRAITSVSIIQRTASHRLTDGPFTDK